MIHSGRRKLGSRSTATKHEKRDWCGEQSWRIEKGLDDDRRAYAMIKYREGDDSTIEKFTAMYRG